MHNEQDTNETWIYLLLIMIHDNKFEHGKTKAIYTKIS